MKVFLTFNTTRLHNMDLTDEQITLYCHQKQEEYQEKHPDWDFVGHPLLTEEDEKSHAFDKLWIDAKTMLSLSDAELIVLPKGWVHDSYCSFVFMVANQYHIPLQYEE